MEKTTLGMQIRLQTDIVTAEERVAEALTAHGFGILTEIDVKATLKEKLDVDHHPYKILGACNPPLAHRALQASPEVGLLLPCNVTLSAANEGAVDVSIVDPLTMMGVMPSVELEQIAQEANQKLRAVIDSLKE